MVLVKIDETRLLKDVEIVGSPNKISFSLYFQNTVVSASFDEKDAKKLRDEIDEWLSVRSMITSLS
jgi:hypothetical protein